MGRTITLALVCRMIVPPFPPFCVLCFSCFIRLSVAKTGWKERFGNLIGTSLVGSSTEPAGVVPPFFKCCWTDEREAECDNVTNRLILVFVECFGGGGS